MEPQLVIAMMHRLCLMTRDNPVLRWGVECKQPLAILLTPPAVIVHTCTIIAYKTFFNLYVPVTANKSFLFHSYSYHSLLLTGSIMPHERNPLARDLI